MTYLDTIGWAEVICGNICNRDPKFIEWLGGKRYDSHPLMDNSEYGLNFIYRFENPEDAMEMKLRFDCTPNP